MLANSTYQCADSAATLAASIAPQSQAYRACALFRDSGPNLHVIGRAPLQQVGQLQANSLRVSRGTRGDARAAGGAAAVAATAVADLLRRRRPGMPCRLLCSQGAGNPVTKHTSSICQKVGVSRAGGRL